MKNKIMVLAIGFLTLSTTAVIGQQRTGTNTRAAVYVASLIDLANKQYDSAENQYLVVRQYERALGAKLISSRQVKSALARCVFMDGAYANLTDAHKAAHSVWVKLRQAIRAGKVHLRLNRDYRGIRYRNLKTYSDSCNVAGPGCAVVFEIPGFASLYAAGDLCQ